MVLAFTEKINNKPTYFVEKIWQHFPCEFTADVFENYIDGLPNFHEDAVDFIPKLHTIRRDASNRWKAGNKIHFTINNRTKNSFQFAPVVHCISTQKIEIKYEEYILEDLTKTRGIKVLIDEKEIQNNPEKLDALIKNDGFSSRKDFFEYFNEDFTGKIIHWTNLKY